MARKEQFANNEFYHIYNRGVDKRQIFMDDFDYLRFIQCLEVFNDVELSGSIYLSSIKQKKEFRSLAPKKKVPIRTKKPLVRILCLCLMSNHFHLLLEQLVENGITEFMHRVGTGFTNFFNIKYERKGRLFEGPFQAILIDKDNYLHHLLRYIHLNPLDFFNSSWREEGIKDWKEAKKFLENYMWSSHGYYLEMWKKEVREKNQVSKVVEPGIFREIFKSKSEYERFLRDWAVKDLEYLDDFILE